MVGFSHNLIAFIMNLTDFLSYSCLQPAIWNVATFIFSRSFSGLSITCVHITLNYLTGVILQVGIQSSETGEKVGTFALAYAAHKAASPIRFPPTVALTPIVARWFGKKDDEKNEEKDGS